MMKPQMDETGKMMDTMELRLRRLASRQKNSELLHLIDSMFKSHSEASSSMIDNKKGVK